MYIIEFYTFPWYELWCTDIQSPHNLQVKLDFELEYMTISNRHSNKNIAYHIVIHWSVVKV